MGTGELGMSSPNYKMDESSNVIHPSAVIEESVELGENNFIGPFCYLTGKLEVGNNNRFEAHCSVGIRAEHKEFWDKDGRTLIGNGNVFRENITIHAGTHDNLTFVGNNVIMLRGSHVAHDCVIEDSVTLSCDAIMLGHVHVMQHSNCGSGCQIHQYQVVGSWSMIGMGCIIPKKARIIPGKIWVGNPAKELNVNTHALERCSVKDLDYDNEFERYKELVVSNGL